MTKNLMYPVDRKPYQKPAAEKQPIPDGLEWRCPACNMDLFGIFKDGKLHIKYRERNLLMTGGVVIVTCRRCRYQASLDMRDYGHPVDIIHSQDDDDLVVTGPVEVTPQAERLAKKANIDLRQIKGSGAGGKIVVADVQKMIDSSSE